MPKIATTAQLMPTGKLLEAKKSGAEMIAETRIDAIKTTGATRATGGRSRNLFSSPYALA